MQSLCDWVKGRSISVSYIYIYILHDGLGLDERDGQSLRVMEIGILVRWQEGPVKRWWLLRVLLKDR